MDIQRISSGNATFTPALSFPNPALASAVNSNVVSTPWLAPEMTAANDALRNFWANFAPPPADDPMPFFGRFLQNAGAQGQPITTAVGEGDGTGPPPDLPGFQPDRPIQMPITTAIGEGDGTGSPLDLPGFQPDRPVQMPITTAIGEGDGLPRQLVGGNTGDAGAPGRRESFTTAVGEGDTAPREAVDLGSTSPGRRGAFTMAVGEGDTAPREAVDLGSTSPARRGSFTTAVGEGDTGA